MTMFTRLKIRPIETIMVFVTLNLVVVVLIAFKAARQSPEMLGFSILAALTACIALAMIAVHIDAPLRKLARDVLARQPVTAAQPKTQFSHRHEIDIIAEALFALHHPAPVHHASDEALRRMEETVRRMSNGDFDCSIEETFDGTPDRLRVRINRLASMLSLNILAIRENTATLKEQARASHGDLAVIAERLTHALPTARKAAGAMEVLNRASLMRHDDADMIARKLQTVADIAPRMIDNAGQVLAAGEAASRSLDRMAALAHTVGDLAIKAEGLASTLSASAAPASGHQAVEASDPASFSRSLADDSMKAARDFLAQCRETELHVADALHAARRLERSATTTGETIIDLQDPAGRLSRNGDLESQRLSLAHLAATETEHVLSRTLDIVQASEGAMIRMMGESSAVETRLSAFTFAAALPGIRPLAGDRPNLRCIT